MAKLTLTDLTSLTNEESAITSINENNARIEDALELTLSRNGTSPNTMSANLDMNSFRLINLPEPVDDNDAVRLIDVVDGIRGPQGEQGPAGASLADGDAGDIVVSGGGTVLTLDPTVVTTAAKTLLDDSSISAMRTTLGLAGAALLAVGTTAGTVAAGDDARFYKFTVTAKDATGNFALNENYLYHTSGSAHTWTIQPFATVAIPVGYQIRIDNAPAGGALTITRGAGVSMYVNGGTSSAGATIAAGGQATMSHSATNIWKIVGPGVS
jgi:hypothetical protein